MSISAERIGSRASDRSTTTARPSSTRGADRRRTGLGRIVRMTRFELGMMVRQKVALMSILLAPATAIGLAAFNKPADPAGWLVTLASMSMFVLILAVYTTTTSTVVSRREAQVLKRFRTSELLPRQMLTAMAMPYVLVGVLQVSALVIAYQQMGAPALGNVGPFAAVVLATTVLSVLAGFATASMTANSERVQFAVLPVMMVGVVSSILVLNSAMSDAVRSLALLAPYASSSDLVVRVLGAPVGAFPPPGFVVDLADQFGVSATTLMTGGDVALVATWCLIFAGLAKRRWRWEPRG